MTHAHASSRSSSRWHDNRPHPDYGPVRKSAGDETIRDIAGHVSKRWRSTIPISAMEPKRAALESIVAKKADPKPAQQKTKLGTEVPRSEARVGNSDGVPTVER